MADISAVSAQWRERLKKPLLWLSGLIVAACGAAFTHIFTDVTKPVIAQVEATICGFIHLPCASSDKPSTGPVFAVIPYQGKGIVFDPDNAKYKILVFYQQGRQEDAGRIVGALQQAGYKMEASLTSLESVVAPDKSPGTTLIKTTTAARPKADEVLKYIRYAVPSRPDSFSSVYNQDSNFVRTSDFQIDLF